MFESAIAFGRAALEELGIEPEAAAAAATDVRKRDIARLILQKAGGTMGGAELVVGAKIAPEPLVASDRKGARPQRRDARHPRRRVVLMDARPLRKCSPRTMRRRRASSSGSTMRHVLVMTGTGAAGLIAIFIVDSRVASLHFVAERSEPDGGRRPRHGGDVPHGVDQCRPDDPDRRAGVARARRAGPTSARGTRHLVPAS